MLHIIWYYSSDCVQRLSVLIFFVVLLKGKWEIVQHENNKSYCRNQERIIRLHGSSFGVVIFAHSQRKLSDLFTFPWTLKPQRSLTCICFSAHICPSLAWFALYRFSGHVTPKHPLYPLSENPSTPVFILVNNPLCQPPTTHTHSLSHYSLWGLASASNSNIDIFNWK